MNSSKIRNFIFFKNIITNDIELENQIFINNSYFFSSQLIKSNIQNTVFFRDIHFLNSDLYQSDFIELSIKSSINNIIEIENLVIENTKIINHEDEGN